MWTIFGLPFWQVVHHEILHSLYSLLFLLVTYFLSWGICWLVGYNLHRIFSTNGFLLLGLLVSLVLVSHYFADEVVKIIPLWIKES